MSLINLASTTGNVAPAPPFAETTEVKGVAPGRVVFIGDSFGDPELLTLGAVHAISEADAIISDQDQSIDIFTCSALTLRPDVEQIVLDAEVGVAEIVAQESQLVGAGKFVVRLVRGDTLTNTVCREEGLALVASGIQIDFLPGVSAVTAIPTYAGSGLSKCGIGQFLFVGSDGLIDAQVPASGDVFVICRSDQVPSLVESAYRAGRSPSEKVHLTFNGAMHTQRSVSIELAKLAINVKRGVSSDSPEFISLVLSDENLVTIDWYESKPLFGWKILIPRTRETVGELESRLAQHGASVQLVPTTSFEPPRNPQQIDKAITGLVDGRYEWIVFTSGNTVRAVLDKLSSYGLDARAFSGLRVAAVGPITAKALQEWGIIPDLVPEHHHSGEGLAAEFPVFDELLDPINRVLVPRADIATEALITELSHLGWDAESVIVYRAVRAAPPPPETREAIKMGKFDAVVFTSSSAVRNLVGIAGKPHAKTVIAAIGPATAATCVEHGLRVDALATHPENDALVEALVNFALQRRTNLLAAGELVVPPSKAKRRRTRCKS